MMVDPPLSRMASAVDLDAVCVHGRSPVTVIAENTSTAGPAWRA